MGSWGSGFGFEGEGLPVQGSPHLNIHLTPYQKIRFLTNPDCPDTLAHRGVPVVVAEVEIVEVCARAENVCN